MNEFVSREDWGALAPRWTKALEPPIMVFRPTVTNTDTCYDKENCAEILQDVQRLNMDTMHMPDIKWNFMISSSGDVYEGRGWRTEGYKTPLMKKEFGEKTVIEIGYIGDFDDVDEVPGNIQLAQQEFISQAMKEKLVSTKYTVIPFAKDPEVKGFKKRKK